MAEDLVKPVVDAAVASRLDAFLAVMETVIAPTMTAIGEGWRAKGYDYNISRVQNPPERERMESWTACIRLTIYDTPRGPGEHYKYPSLAFSCSKAVGKVDFHFSATGPKHAMGAIESGALNLDRVTPELIQQQALKMMAEMSF